MILPGKNDFPQTVVSKWLEQRRMRDPKLLQQALDFEKPLFKELAPRAQTIFDTRRVSRTKMTAI